MYNQLPQLHRIQSITQELQRTKSNLSQLVTRNYNSSPLKDSFRKTMQELILEIQQKLEIMHQIEQQIIDNTLVPSSIDYKSIIVQVQQIPQWFQSVFQKQFTQHKKNFDIAVKNSFQSQRLNEERGRLEKQFQKFKLIYSQYEELQTQERNYHQLIFELEKNRNKVQMVQSKYLNLLELVTNKIIAYINNMLRKSLNFHTSIKNQGQIAAHQMHNHGVFMRNPSFYHPFFVQDRYKKASDPNYATMNQSYFHRDPFFRPDFSRNTISRQPIFLSSSNRSFNQNPGYLPRRVISDLHHM